MQNNLTHLVQVFGQITDPRSKKGTYLPCSGILALTFPGLLAEKKLLPPQAKTVPKTTRIPNLNQERFMHTSWWTCLRTCRRTGEKPLLLFFSKIANLPHAGCRIKRHAG